MSLRRITTEELLLITGTVECFRLCPEGDYILVVT